MRWGIFVYLFWFRLVFLEGFLLGFVGGGGGGGFF